MLSHTKLQGAAPLPVAPRNRHRRSWNGTLEDEVPRRDGAGTVERLGMANQNVSWFLSVGKSTLESLVLTCLKHQALGVCSVDFPSKKTGMEWIPITLVDMEDVRGCK